MKSATVVSVFFLVLSMTGASMARDYEATPETFAGIVEGLAAGDTVNLADGDYKGGVVIRASGERDKPIVIKAAGDNVVFRGGGDEPVDTKAAGDRRGLRGRRNGIRLEGDYIVVEGIKVTEAQNDGISSGHNTGCVIRNCVCYDNGNRGIFSGFSEGLVVEGNECRGSKAEHGIYISNSTDHAIVRGNYCHDNAGCGIQFNGDPRVRGGDGVMSFNLIEGNILHDNFTNMNLACFSDSIVRNNLIYHCKSKAISLCDNTTGFEYGSKNNVIINNTIIMDYVTRECIQLRNGSTGNTIRNNLFVCPFYTITADISSAEGTVIDHNLYSGSREPEKFLWAGEYLEITDMQERGFCEGAVLGNIVFTTARALRRFGVENLPLPIEGPRFVDYATDDYRLTPDSPAIDAGTSDERAADVDLGGNPRVSGATIDIGAYELQKSD